MWEILLVNKLFRRNDMEFETERTAARALPVGTDLGGPDYSIRRGRSHTLALQRPVARKPTREALIQSFNSWAFKREHPDNIERLQSLAQTAIDDDRPLSFVLYWGRGPRESIAPPDRQCLDYLSQLARRVAGLHSPGAALTIIFTDTHAALNGYSEISTRRYYAEIEHEAAQRGFKSCFLGDLVNWAEAHIDAGRAEEAPSAEFLSQLIASAAKWFRGEGECEDGALRYYKTNMIEKQAVEAAFKESVFITFSGSEHRSLLPDGMPIFFMYSIRRGVGVKPWFMTNEPDDPQSDRAHDAVAS